MTWATPLIAGIAAAIAIPLLLLLYFLKLKRREMAVSSTLLWKKAIEDLQANAPFQKLRRNILLILQMLALLLLLAAIGQPRMQADQAKGVKHVLVIDRSASMQSMDGDPEKPGAMTRLEAAQRDAIALVESMAEPGLFDGGRGDEAMVIAFDTTAEVRQQFTADKELLKAAIEGIETSDAPSRIAEAFVLATAHAKPPEVVEDVGLVQGFGASIELWSDGRLPDAGDADLASADELVYHAVGSTDAINIGITELRAQRQPDNPTALSIFTGLQSTDTIARQIDVELLINGKVSAVRSVSLAPAERSATGQIKPGVGGVVFEAERTQGGLITVRIPSGLAGQNVLRVDDSAWLVVPPAKRLRVALVSRSLAGEAIRFALDPETLGLKELVELSPEEFQAAAADKSLGRFDVVVLDGWVPAMPKGSQDWLPPGAYLILGAVPGAPSGLVNKGKGEVSLIVDWDREHPVLESVSLDSVVLYEPRQVEVGPDSLARVLASSDSGPVILEMVGPESRSIVVPIDVASSNWPFDVSFVVFLASSVRHLGLDASLGPASVLIPGRVLSQTLPAGARDVRLLDPSGKESKLVPSSGGAVVYGPIRQVGTYTISWQGEAGSRDEQGDSGRVHRQLAASLLDSEESVVSTSTTLTLAPRVVQARQGQSQRAMVAIWPWLMLGVVAMVLVEWFVYNRKVHV